MELTFRFISQYDELHGICILLKPNEARLDVIFRFCIKELLVRLHRTASANICFCFTNSRSTFYQPGDTYPVLKQLLSEYKDSNVVLSNHTNTVSTMKLIVTFARCTPKFRFLKKCVTTSKQLESVSSRKSTSV
jgi:hypothetical protein